MPDDEKVDGEQGGNQGEGSGGGHGADPDDPGEFELGYEVRHRDPAGSAHKAAPERPQPEPDSTTTTPDPDDPGEFRLTDLTEEESRRPRP